MADSDTGASVSVSLRVLAVASLLVALASLGTLVVVVSLKDIDSLSTLALALAVLAFVVQLIVFVVQAADVSRQSALNQTLHAQMMTILAQIQERTQGTQASVDRMNTRLLEAVIGKATSEGYDVSSPEFAQTLARGLRSTPPPAMRSQSGEVDDWEEPTGDEWPEPLPPEEARLLLEEMTTWPEPDRADEVSEILGKLTDYGLKDLYSLANDLRNSTRPNAGLGPGLGMYSRNDQVVVEGLAEKIPGWNLYTLSPMGRLVGRVLIADGDPPDRYQPLLPLREKAKRLWLERRAAIRRRE